MLKFSLFFSLIFFLSVVPAKAHTGGSSYEVKFGEITIDTGYDPATISTGEYARYDFNLKNPAGEYMTYDHVWVRLRHNEETVLATGVRYQELGPTTLLYQFAHPGQYDMELSFRKSDGREFASTTVPVLVAAASETNSDLLLGIICGGIVGILLSWITLSAKRRLK